VVQPAKRHAYAQSDNNVFTPVERELIFDIVSFSDLSLLLKVFIYFGLLDIGYPLFIFFLSWWALGYDRL